jgi:hypothetical protein
MCLTSSIIYTCEDESAVGGFRKVYAASRDSVLGFTVGADHTYTAVSMASTAVSDQFHEISFTDYTAVLAWTNELGDTGANSIGTDFQLAVPKVDTVKSNQLNILKECCKLVLIAITNEGNALVMGWDEKVLDKGALRVQVNGNIGAALLDGNNYALQFTGQQVELPYNFTGTILVSGSPVVIS